MTIAANGAGTLIEIEADALCQLLAADAAILVDVREEWEFAEARIPGAVSLPLSRFDLAALPETDGRALVLTCAIGGRSARAATMLLASGLSEVTHLRGGMTAWQAASLRTISGGETAGGRLAEAALLPCVAA